MKLIWSARAKSDLIGIGEFIAGTAPENARQFVQRLVERAGLAARFPAAGRSVPEYQDENLREVIEGNYRIVYEIQPSGKTVIVITVFDAHRLIATDLK